MAGGILDWLQNAFGGGPPSAGGPAAPTQVTAYNQNLNSNQTGQVNQNQNQNNVYSGDQQALQGQVAQGYGQAVAGGANPQPVIDAWNQNYDQNVSPQVVAAFGAGSPQDAAQRANGMTQLLGSLWGQQQGINLNNLNSAASFATAPQGVDASGATNNQQAVDQQVNGTQGSGVSGSILSMLARLFK